MSISPTLATGQALLGTSYALPAYAAGRTQYAAPLQYSQYAAPARHATQYAAPALYQQPAYYTTASAAPQPVQVS